MEMDIREGGNGETKGRGTEEDLGHVIADIVVAVDLLEAVTLDHVLVPGLAVVGIVEDVVLVRVRRGEGNQGKSQGRRSK